MYTHIDDYLRQIYIHYHDKRKIKNFLIVSSDGNHYEYFYSEKLHLLCNFF